MCCHNYGSSNFLFGIDLHFHPGGLRRRQLYLLFLYLALKTLSMYVRKCGAVVECQIVTLKDKGSRPSPVMLLLKLSSSVEEVRHFKSLSKKFDIYSKIVCRDVKNFFRHQSELVLRHQMQVSNYFVNFFYSVSCCRIWTF
jgi:hypothetical protein